MKFFPKSPKDVRVSTDDSLGHGMDAVGVLVLFLGLGWLLDRGFGTMPVFMILMTVIASVGLFAKFKYGYDARMDELEGERVAKLRGVSAAPRNAESNGEAA